MATAKRYDLNDFTKHAKTNYPAQFEALANNCTYRFGSISYMNGNQEGRQADMLRIGHYYHKHGGPSVWAHTNGYDVRYYYGQSSEVCELVPKAHKARMYFDAPFCLMGVTQGSTESKRGRTQARKFEKEVFETVVHFVFLLSGRLQRVNNALGADMLGNLKFACMTLERNRKPGDLARHAQPGPARTMQARRADQGQEPEAENMSNVIEVRLERGASVAEVTPIPRTFTAANDTLPRPDPSPLPNRTSLIDNLLRFESAMETQLAQAAHTHRKEAEALHARLVAQESKTHAAEARLVKHKRKRDDARAEAERWKAKYARVKERYAKRRERYRVKKEE